MDLEKICLHVGATCEPGLVSQVISQWLNDYGTPAYINCDLYSITELMYLATRAVASPLHIGVLVSTDHRGIQRDIFEAVTTCMSSGNHTAWQEWMPLIRQACEVLARPTVE